MNPLHKASGSYSETRIDGEVVLMQLDSGVFFSLTGTGAEAWDLLDGTRDREALIATLAQQYATDETAIAPDIDAFLDQLMGAGLVGSG